MGGIAVLFILSIYIVITVVLVIKVKGLPYKAVALLVMLLIPTADAIYGRYKLKQMCAAEAGLKVYKVAHNVEGFMDGDSQEYWVKIGGFQYIEGNLANGTVTRYFKRDGQIVFKENVNPKSQYRIDSKYIGWIKDSYMRHQMFIKNLNTEEILATDTQIAFNGGWAERFLAQFSDAGGGAVVWCANVELNPLVRHQNLVKSSLKL